MTRICVLFLTCFFCFSCSDPKPTLTELVDHFYANENEYNKLAQLACAIDAKQNQFSVFDDKFVYGRRVKQENRIEEIDILLSKVNATSIRYELTPSGKCSLSFSYYSRGFATAAIGFSYTYQKANKVIKPTRQETIDSIIEEGERNIIIDMILNEKWAIKFLFS